MTYSFILCLPSLDARERKVSGTAAVQAKLFDGMPFQFNAEVERMASASGICRSVFICLGACARASFCVCASFPCHRILITSSHTCFPRRLSPPLIPHFSCLLIKGRSSHSCRFLSPPFPPCYPPPHRAGLAWVQQPPLPLYHHVCLSNKTLQVSCDSLGGKFMQLG